MFKAIKKKMKDQRGLTLVELLAVVVILGIVSAIAVPSIGGIINKTKDDAKVAEALQIINAAKLSHASNSSFTSWKHTKAATDGATVGELSDMVENVKTDSAGYTVTYSTADKTYSIKGHPGVGVVKDISSYDASTNTTVATEADLLGFTGN
ncbi:type IV pilin protein [Mesobacillus sp.]|uniref:type IV pilin protein n=1 Tax=Mesobacillus sp. TaxID=2675271 RepID=UPI0039F0D7D2